MKKLTLALCLLLSLASQLATANAHAAWSCDCAADGEVFIVDGETEAEARQSCTSNDEEKGYSGEVISCQSRGRGDR